IGLLVLLVLFFVGMYNRLVALRNRVENAWSQIDVQLKRRHDLIPNLVETCKGYMKHERGVFESVANARNQAISATSIPEKAAAENVLTGALRQLFAVAEAYPELKANQNMLALQEELTSTENKVSFARQFYNDSVMQFNQTLQQVPTNIVADMFNFRERVFFEVEDKADREPVKVQF
ncbi:MAG: hypothetical protein A2Z21_08890, partial [Candidatus Fraserbacteria bacterium RBG_16_55_9]